jgi:GT2 family glycosyltransferase
LTPIHSEGSALPEDVVSRRSWESSRPTGSPLPGAGFSVVVCTYKRAESFGRFVSSLLLQVPRPESLIVVDATPDASTEELLAARTELHEAARRVVYFRVTGGLRGLTRQRKFGLSQVGSELVIFCDDDIVLKPDCLERLLGTLAEDPRIVAAVPFVENETGPPPLRWRFLCALGAVPSLQPGRYYASGISVPWRFQPPTDRTLEGDWLYGCVMAWRTDAVRSLGFSTEFEGYGNGEDVDLTMRGRVLGKRVLVGAAKVHHHHEMAGRPDALELGFMSLRNAWSIHRRCVPGRRWYHSAWFAYATMLTAVMRGVNVFRPSRSRDARRFLLGQFRFLWSGLTGRAR